jgi:IS1 family transposase
MRFGRSLARRTKNVPEQKKDQFGIGSVWTWTAIDADTKLVPCWMVGPRDGGAATEFIQDLAGRLRHRVQLTTDGHKPYLDAVEDSFGCDIDYAMLIKMYGADGTEEKSPCRKAFLRPRFSRKPTGFVFDAGLDCATAPRNALELASCRFLATPNCLTTALEAAFLRV